MKSWNRCIYASCNEFNNHCMKAVPFNDGHLKFEDISMKKVTNANYT